MEKKKLLLVAVSVGVFLVIVVSAAILVFRPGNGSPTVVSSVNSELSHRSATTDPSELARDDSYRGLQNPDANSPIQENYINNNGDSTINANPQEGTRTVIVPKPSAPAVPEVKTVIQTKPAVKPAPAQAAPVEVKPAAAPKKAYKDFWVQAGSFSTRERADGVKSTLGTKGISAVVTNQQIDGSIYYRVRVGPYTSHNEADYWLAMIKSIDGFQDSQIWESQSYR